MHSGAKLIKVQTKQSYIKIFNVTLVPVQNN